MWNYGREMADQILADNATYTGIVGVFYMPQNCDMDRRLYFSSEERHAEDFFGFEPANLGTRGQHANHQTTEAAACMYDIRNFTKSENTRNTNLLFDLPSYFDNFFKQSRNFAGSIIE
jgi:hypothetical protein